MNKFIKQLFIFFAFFGLIFLIGIFLPVTPKAKDNMLSYKLEKDSLLMNVKEPRIIFIGGSNLVFGLNSQMIKDSLELNPVNHGLAASIGLIYMMEDVYPYIQPGDYVVIAVEYQNYYGKFAYGGNDLLRLLMDVQRSGFSKLRVDQTLNLLESWPIYFMTKFRPSSYFYESKNDVYSRYIFNEYGDSYTHWNLPTQDFPQLNPIKGSLNQSVVREIKEFSKKLQDKGATLLVTYPACQKSSVELNYDQIERIQNELENSNLHVLGSANRYSFPDNQMFNQAYHLSGEGVNLRTQKLIEDIKIYQKK